MRWYISMDCLALRASPQVLAGRRWSRDVGGAVLFAHRNQQYSIYAYSNSSGAIVETHRLHRLRPTHVHERSRHCTVDFAQFDSLQLHRTRMGWSLKLHHFRARWITGYNGIVSFRDIQLDFRRKQFNLFEYVRGNPVFLLEPLGLQTQQTSQFTERKTNNFWIQYVAKFFSALGYALPRGIQTFIDELTSPSSTTSAQLHSR